LGNVFAKGLLQPVDAHFSNLLAAIVLIHVHHDIIVLRFRSADEHFNAVILRALDDVAHVVGVNGPDADRLYAHGNEIFHLLQLAHCASARVRDLHVQPFGLALFLDASRKPADEGVGGIGRAKANIQGFGRHRACTHTHKHR